MPVLGHKSHYFTDYAARGSAEYATVLVLAINCLLPVLRVEKRARLAVQEQPSSSKPVIPEG